MRSAAASLDQAQDLLENPSTKIMMTGIAAMRRTMAGNERYLPKLCDSISHSRGEIRRVSACAASGVADVQDADARAVEPYPRSNLLTSSSTTSASAMGDGKRLGTRFIMLTRPLAPLRQDWLEFTQRRRCSLPPNSQSHVWTWAGNHHACGNRVEPEGGEW